MSAKVKNRPLQAIASELVKVGIEVLDPYRLWLRCVKCGLTWQPKWPIGRRLPSGYWKCPGGCNEPKSDRI
jgi:hypothetical protein